MPPANLHRQPAAKNTPARSTPRRDRGRVLQWRSQYLRKPSSSPPWHKSPSGLPAHQDASEAPARSVPIPQSLRSRCQDPATHLPLANGEGPAVRSLSSLSTREATSLPRIEIQSLFAVGNFQSV